jgi:hypothetical protein
MRKMLGIVVAACAVAAPALGWAWPAEGLKTEDIADWLRRQHLDAQIDEPRAGATATVVRSTLDGTPFAIYLYDCRKDRCASLQYEASFSNTENISLARLNNWNRQSRYVRAYLDRSGRVIGEYDLDIAPGMDAKGLDHSLRRWRSALSRFRQFVGGL